MGSIAFAHSGTHIVHIEVTATEFAHDHKVLKEEHMSACLSMHTHTRYMELIITFAI